MHSFSAAPWKLRWSPALADDFDHGKPACNFLLLNKLCMTQSEIESLCVPSQPVHQHSTQMTRKLQSSSNRAIVGFIQYIHCVALHVVQLMRLRTGCWWNIIKYSPLNTSCAYLQMPRLNTDVWICWMYCFQINIIFSFGQRHQFHIYSSDLMTFTLAVGANHLFFFARSQCAYPNRVTASPLAVRNFLAVHSHYLGWQQDDLDISGSQTLLLRSTPVQLTLEFLFIYLLLEFYHEVQSKIRCCSDERDSPLKLF